MNEIAYPGAAAGKLRVGMAVAALGVVYGDIGTSPLYTLRECLNSLSLHPTTANVLGILSLIFWTVMIIVTFKYVLVVMRADNHGEGGTLALLSQVLGAKCWSPRAWWMLLVAGIIGTSLFYGDGIITPAISVLSAVEGLEVATPLFKPYVIPITVVILGLLFMAQHRGTSKVGAFFGPVMVIWFAVLAVTGAIKIAAEPIVVEAVDPLYALEFTRAHGLGTFLTLGAVFLAVTGAEALYADIGHFGAKPIKAAWLYMVLPALMINYFGQGALLLASPAAIKNPFFLMVPDWGLMPMVVLATVATIIASQAVITGAFSLTQQAMQLGYIPRLEICHTSAAAEGQIYVPWVNWALLIAIVGLVLGFRSSSNMAAAYGIAVTGTMVSTTFLLYFHARKNWGWSVWAAGSIIGFFLAVDLMFFGANSLKVAEGGWFPLVVGAILFTIMSTWRKGRIILFERLYPEMLPLDQFVTSLSLHPLTRVAGTAVFLTARGEGVPHGILHNLKHNKVLHERVVILTILTDNVPRVVDEARAKIKDMGCGFFRINAHFGFMETPDVPGLLDLCKRLGFEWNIMETSFFLNRQRVIPTGSAGGMALWRERLYAMMVRNAGNATDFFKIPPNRVIELGSRVEI